MVPCPVAQPNKNPTVSTLVIPTVCHLNVSQIFTEPLPMAYRETVVFMNEEKATVV